MDSNNNTDTTVMVPEETFEEQNRRFLALSDAERRIAIANDVLLQIQLGKYQSRTIGFIQIRFSETAQFGPQDSLRELFPQVEVCDVCALGGLFLSCTRLNNKTKVGSVRDYSRYELGENWEVDERSMGELIRGGHQFSNQLNVFFSNQQLALIEIAFEEGHGSFQVRESFGNHESKVYRNEDGKILPITPEIERAVNFSKNNSCECFDQRTLRLQKIMENIIANGGTFVP